METAPIGSLEDGRAARVRGAVRRAHQESVRSPLGERECVYWDVRVGLDGAPAEQGGEGFWIEDATGRALVPTEALRVEARASRQEQVVEAADADYQVISERLRDLKDQLRVTSGERAGELVRERKRLAKLATLLCAIKAHARGRKHLGGSLESQARWIEKNAGLAQAEDGVRATELMVSRWETVIAEGQTIEVEATFRREPAPPGVGVGGGYRERPTCLVARPLGDGAVKVIGVGASAPRTAVVRRRVEARSEPARTSVRRSGSERRDPSFERLVLTTLIVVAFVAVTVWLLRA